MVAILDAILNFSIYTVIVNYMIISYESYMIGATIDMHNVRVNVKHLTLFQHYKVYILPFCHKMVAILAAILDFY